MADLQDFSIARNGSVNATVPRYTISAKVTESSYSPGGPPIIADFTGGNSLSFPGVLLTLTDDQRDEFINMIALWLIKIKAGV